MTAGGSGPAAGDAEAAIWNPATLRALFGDDAATIAAVVETFMASMRVSLAEVGRALDEGRAADLRAIAHRIKGAARMSGAPALAGAAESLERMAPDATPAALAVAVTALQGQWQQLERVHTP